MFVYVPVLTEHMFRDESDSKSKRFYCGEFVSHV